MDKNRLSYLFQQYQRRSQSPAEREEWLAALSDPALDALLHEVTGEEWGKSSHDELPPADAAAVYRQVVSQPQPGRVRRLWPRIAVAASILVCIAVGGYLYREQGAKAPAVTRPLVQDVAPGANRATLTLANGQKIILSDDLNGEIAKQAGVQINKSKNGVLTYTVEENNDQPANSVNTLSTARGKLIKLSCRIKPKYG
ncbi:hypothetical protein MKQ70_06825 [Chitinophaga sedimenti]|uniref:hypothetical protein n=1 Tax=Chitinophaga sedimenti TaxID=2033606 RepID=UPI00200598B3|nr:hypothetical protein [Chitinophaga sedimenti]MCK7554730.1 hypothetical protein [Chitinophaga sedimenti]